MKNKITTRTAVYRAIYYSGFNWKRSRETERDIYTLNVTDTDSITLTHVHRDEVDVLEAKANFEIDPNTSARLIRLFNKIQRRTKNLVFEQTLINLEEKGETK